MRTLNKRKYKCPNVETQKIDNEISLILMSYTGDDVPGGDDGGGLPSLSSSSSTIKLKSSSSSSTSTSGFDENPFTE